jgi:hypothetical protein
MGLQTGTEEVARESNSESTLASLKDFARDFVALLLAAIRTMQASQLERLKSLRPNGQSDY